MAAIKQSDHIDPLYDKDASAAYVHRTPRYMEYLAQTRRIPHYVVGHRLRFRRSDLDAYLASCRVEQA